MLLKTFNYLKRIPIAQPLRKIYIASVRLPRNIRMICLNLFVIGRAEMLAHDFRFGSTKIREKCTDFNLCVENNEANEYFSDIIGQHPVPDRFLIELPNAYLIGPWAIPITENGKIILETSGNLRTLEHNIRRSGRRFELARILSLLLLIRLTYMFSFLPKIGALFNYELFHLVPRHGHRLGEPNYSHWLFENLPQLEPCSPELYETVKIYVGESSKEWQTLSLKMLGVPSSSILVKKFPYISRVRKLFISRMPYIHTNGAEFDPHGRRWVNDTLRANLNEMSFIKFHDYVNYKSCIAFCRRKSGRRTFENIKELDEVLERNGYSIIMPESIPELEKIKLSFCAKKIIGYPSGSALANMIFSSAELVIDIIPDDHFVSIWFILTRELGFQYIPVFASAMSKDSDYKLTAQYLNSKIKC